ncbi:S-layer homology domain-containing protein [Paenibacillus sp. L3-i20]|uniref:S-layer homology domain-containing protein n=1 Tax=Paenibacillus sp. L3-i20 TaxID=2905833 RepID=UPI001EDD6C03|nr:S-layer homology domain-containing protein [Paenibacillus sp. L3-i20]GKU80252.1 hypothetical protein L3i20_v246490 [Paenibacillus sp. L3-i20]
MKKIFSVILPFTLAVALLFPAQATTTYGAEPVDLEMYFPVDIEEHWAYNELDNFVSADLLKGYEDYNGVVTVKPEKSVTRAEFVTMLVRALSLKSNQAGKSFTDVTEDEWYYESIRIASSLGVVNGVGESQFEPNKFINRGDIATMVVRAFQNSVSFNKELGETSFIDVPNYYATESIASAYEIGIVNGVTEQEFRPFSNAKRAEAVVMLQRALDLQMSDLPTDKVLFDNVLNSQKEAIEIINSKQFDQLEKLSEKYFTGYELAVDAEYNAGLIGLVSEGVNIGFQITSEQQLTVLDKTDRFAIVESTKGAYSISTDKDGETSKTDVSNDGIYLLKKMNDDSWRIYAFFLSEEQ